MNRRSKSKYANPRIVHRDISLKFNNRTADPSSSLPTAVECRTKVSTLKVRKADRVPNSLECTSYDAPGAALSLSRRAWTSRGHTCLKSVVLSSRTVPGRLYARNLVGLSLEVPRTALVVSPSGRSASRKTDCMWHRSNEFWSCSEKLFFPLSGLRDRFPLWARKEIWPA